MSVETTHMRLPITLKDDLARLQERFYCKTNYEVIEKLIRHLDAFDKYRQQVIQEKEAQKERERREMLDVGEQEKECFEKIKHRLHVESDENMLGLLMHHFESSMTVSMSTLEYLAAEGRVK